MAVIGLESPPCVGLRHMIKMGMKPMRCSYIPDYGIPRPDKIGTRPLRRQMNERGRKKISTRDFWDYKIPTASVGAPSGYGLSSIVSRVLIPAYGPPGGNGNGGRGGGGWGGGNGGNGDPMKGFTYLFAIFMFVAGAFAYFKKGSTKSMIVATAAAALLLVAASLMGHPTSMSGTYLALATCIALAGIMGWRAKETGKMMPAGGVAALSALMTIGYVVTMIT